MLTFNQLPPWLDELDEKSRSLGTVLDQRLQSCGKALLLRRSTDASQNEQPGFYFVISGTLKWCDNGHLVRMYSNGDWVAATPAGAGQGARLESDFACDLRFYPRAEFLAALAADPDAQRLWQEYQDQQVRILLGMTGVLSTDETTPNFELRSFAKNEVILTEGSTTEEVYVLLEGHARAELGGRVIGTIGPNEVFGEISFFTQQPRSATVIADGHCLVQIVSQENFALLIRAKPDLLAHVAKTLAHRVVDLNRRMGTTPKPSK